MRRKIEFSKILWAISFTSAAGITLFACYMAYITMDTSVFAYLIPAVYAELATATGFYYNKAKAENAVKLKKYYGIGADDL